MTDKVCADLKYKRILLARLISSLVKRDRPFAHFSPPLALKYIESLLAKAGNVDVKVFDCHIRGYSVEDAARVSYDFRPELLVIDINSYEFQTALGYVELLKKLMPSLVVIAIGQGPTANPARYMEFFNLFDIILPGEPETETVSILNDLNRGKGVGFLKNKLLADFQQGKRLKVADLDSLPFPRYDQYEIERYRFLYPIRINKRVRWGYVLSSRGCPYECIFCAPPIRKTSGREIRFRSASNVVDEIEYLIDRYDINVLCFSDDNFTTSRSHAENICHEILRRGVKIKWVAHARIDEVDFSLLSLMKKTGCDLLRFGIESGSERIIALLKKTNKTNWRSQALSTFDNTRRLRIGTLALFMLGNPAETEEEIISTIQLAKKLKPDLIQIHFFTPYPGSPVYEEVKSSLKDVDVDKLYHYGTPSLLLCHVDAERLKKLRLIFYIKLLLSPDYLSRHILNYAGFYLFNREIFRQALKIGRYVKGG